MEDIYRRHKGEFSGIAIVILKKNSNCPGKFDLLDLGPTARKVTRLVECLQERLLHMV